MKNITNKNSLIFKVKKMAMDRGFRGKLSMQQNDGKGHTVIMICNKAGKSTAKNPSIKAECPFLLHFERKSFLQNQLRKQRGGCKDSSTDSGVIKEEVGEDSEIMESKDRSKSKFDSKSFKNKLDVKTKDDKVKREGVKANGEVIDVPGDPFFLAKYRSFHNHDLDTNYVEHSHLVMDEDLHKKGSANLLP